MIQEMKSKVMPDKIKAETAAAIIQRYSAISFLLLSILLDVSNFLPSLYKNF